MNRDWGATRRDAGLSSCSGSTVAGTEERAMLRTELIYFKRILSLSSIHFEGLHRGILQSGLDQDVSEGFISVERTPDSISAVLMVRRHAMRRVFVEGRLLERTIAYYRQIPFAVDSRYSTIEVFAGAKRASKVASVIGRMLRFEYPIEDLLFPPIAVYRTLMEAGYQLEIEQLFIRNFHPAEGVIGRFSPLITQTPKGLALLEEYDRDVTDAVYKVKSPNQAQFTLRVSITGGLAIRAESEEIDSTLETLKRLLLVERRTDA
jgi:hypothetical protein